MSNITVEQLKASLDNEYAALNTENVREYADTCYAIIGIKGNNPSVNSYKRSIYVDVKDFITHHIKQSDSEDYGYDIPNAERMKNALGFLQPSEQLALYRYLKVQYSKHGFDSSIWDENINKLGLKIAWKQHHYVSAVLKFSALNIWTLILSYLVFVFVVFLVIHDAPFAWMGGLDVSLYNFSEVGYVNYCMNALAIVSGENYGQTVIPANTVGMVLIILGKIVFYVLIVNFVLKKLSDFFSFE